MISNLTNPFLKSGRAGLFFSFATFLLSSTQILASANEIRLWDDLSNQWMFCSVQYGDIVLPNFKWNCESRCIA